MAPSDHLIGQRVAELGKGYDLTLDDCHDILAEVEAEMARDAGAASG
jgi:hypothetical protein